MLDAAAVHVARLKDGRLIFSLEPRALDKVFAQCVSPAAPAATLARLVASFSEHSGLDVLVADDSPSLGSHLLKKAGRPFAPPEISVDQGTRVIQFYALSSDGSVLYELKGRIGNQVAVEAQELASNYY